MQKLYKEKAITGVYWMGLMSAINIFFNLLIVMVLSRLLDAYDFGVVAAIMIVISFAEIFWMMGVGPAIVQKKTITTVDIKTGNILNILFGISVYVVIFVFAPYIVSFVGIDNILMLKIVALVFLIQSFSGVSESLLQRDMNFKVIGLIQTISLVIYGLVAILFSILDYGAWALILAQILQVTARSLLSIFKRPIKMSIIINKNSAKELFHYGSGYTLSKLFNNIATQGDNFVINKTLGSSALGFYNRAYQLLKVPTDLIGTVSDKVLFPLLSKFQDKNDKLSYIYLNMSSMIALITCPIMIISLIMGNEFINVFLGSNWNKVVIPFKILILSLYFRVTYKLCNTVLKSIGAIYRRLWTQIVYASTIILGAFIGKEWGIIGVTIATSIAITINYLIMAILVHYLIKVKISHLMRYLLPIIIFSLIIGTVNYFFSLILETIVFDFIRLILIALLVIIMYIVGFRFVLIKLMPKDFYVFYTTIVSTTIDKVLLFKFKKRRK